MVCELSRAVTLGLALREESPSGVSIEGRIFLLRSLVALFLNLHYYTFANSLDGDTYR